MDRNTVIGLSLIVVMVVAYFYYFAPPATQPPVTAPEVTTVDAGKPDSVTAKPETKISDSLMAKQYGSLSAFLSGEAVLTTVETKDLRVVLSNQATLREVELLNFKTYTQKPLLLSTAESNSFSLGAIVDGKDVDLYRLFYAVKTTKEKDATIVTFEAAIGAGIYIRHIYTIPGAGYKIGYAIETGGLDGKLNGDALKYNWVDHIALQEKDITDSRTRTALNYYTAKEAFEDVSDNTANEAVGESLKWVSIQQKFFISAIIADKQFNGGEFSFENNALDSNVVKTSAVKLNIPKGDVLAHQAKFSYFFGPNDYDIVGDVAPGFSKNLYLGWPPVIWVNKFLIIPIFHFLERFISNYGIIIVLLVLCIKLILSPLSYSSYIGMAKMKLLKPELDAIKEKNGDNMAQNQQDQMTLYKQAGVNPFSGCIPLLLQMPILFSMLYFFPMAIQLRQQPFLWAEDLSTYDSIMQLPFTIPFYGDHVSLFVLLMTASTLVYTWQNNQISSVQGPMKSMSYIMPLIFLFILNKFAAGLSFYYFVSNLVTFAQQAIIRRFVDDSKIQKIMEDNKKKAASAPAGTGKKSSFMARIEAAMKAQEEAKRLKK